MTAHSGEGQTLFEMARDKFAGWWFGVKPEPPKKELPKNPLPQNFYNPLRFVPGGYVKIGADGLDDMLFRLKNVYELTRAIDGQKFKVTDYSLHCATQGGEEGTWRTVRALDKGDGTFDCILFTPYKKFGYDKDFETLLGGKQLADNELGITFDKQGVYKTSVREVTLKGSQPSGTTKYWDFVNTEKDAVRILCVEMDLDNGSFELYQGQMIDPLDVTGTSGHTAAEAA